jgi:hypothetical protein
VNSGPFVGLVSNENRSLDVGRMFDRVLLREKTSGRVAEENTASSAASALLPSSSRRLALGSCRESRRLRPSRHDGVRLVRRGDTDGAAFAPLQIDQLVNRSSFVLA